MSKQQTAPYMHVWNVFGGRGSLFRKVADYRRFQLLLYLCNTKSGLRVGNELRRSKTNDWSDVYTLTRIPDSDRLVHISAFCLMKKEFHLLVQPTTKDSVAKFIQKLGTAYAMYFNEKYDNRGGLFKGPYSSETFPTRPKATTGFSTVHLQPLATIDKDWDKNPWFEKEYVDDHLQTHEFSSYHAYRDPEHPTNAILSGKPPIKTDAGNLASVLFDYAPFQGK